MDTTAHNHIAGQLPHRHGGYDDDYYGGGYNRYSGYGGYGGYGANYGSGGRLYGLRKGTNIELGTERLVRMKMAQRARLSLR